MIIEKLQNQKEFTRQEKAVANYIQRHRERVLGMTSEELGKCTYTSKSTVIRLCKKMGVSGYQELKTLLFAEKRNAFKEKEPIELREEYRFEDFIETQRLLYERFQQSILVEMDKNVINRVMARLVRAKKIEIYATGLGYAVALAAAHKFNSLGVECNVSSTANEQYLAAMDETEKKEIVAILISFSGKNPAMINIGRLLKQNHIYAVGLLGGEGKRKMDGCEEVMYLSCQDIILNGTEHMDICYAENYYFDLFYLKMLSLKKNYMHFKP